ncbi:hypothetical protein EVAR_32345_1 [Eumeta japonica]|uniref:Uncharacterized protein n=1 Tax=Eumeta variegata TaxID=151549 RepID=A0A4C1ZCQ6_EUMVA|nr:hypothetical protein EVAR_32345_1 [Eumeta japonica]
MFRTDRSVISHYCYLATRAPSFWIVARFTRSHAEDSPRNAVSQCHSAQCRKRRTVASDVNLSVVINWSSIHVIPSPVESRRRQAGLRDHFNLSRHNQAPIILTDQDARCGSVIDQIFSDIC